jgi:hypothetical protein
MHSPDYPYGFDVGWIATDRNGHVGIFITAGRGPIPTRILDKGDVRVGDIEGIILDFLPRLSDYRLLINVPRPDSFIEFAARGLFVFDWTDIHRSSGSLLCAYEPVAVPLTPIAADALPPNVAPLAVGITLDEVAFADTKTVDVRRLMECRDGNVENDLSL